MKAVLIRPINPNGSAYLRSFGFLPSPLGLIQLAGDIRAVNENNEIKIIDMEADETDISKVINETVNFHPDLVGITLHATAAHNVAINIAKEVKEQSPDTVLVAGGHHATFVPEEMVRNYFDVVVMGEGDETIMDLSKAIENHEDFKNIKGIVYKDKENIIRRTHPRPLILNLDELPMPAYDLVDREKYPFDVFGNSHAVACIETSRGCPYACEFCSVTPTWGNTWRSKSNKRIIKELRELKKLGYDWIFFTDDIFIVYPNIKQRMELFDDMINENLNFNFISQMRVDITAKKPEVIKKASDAGLSIAFLGVESGDDDTLKSMHKGTVTSLAEKAVKILHENGVVILIGLILGSPYDTLKKMWKTVKFAYRLSDFGADSVQFSIYTPLPGTRSFIRALKENKIFTLNWDYYDLLLPVMKIKTNPVLVQFLQYYGNYTFYVRKWIKSKIYRQKIPEKKLKLLREAEKYFINKIPHYTKEIVIGMPKNLLRTWKLYREDKEDLSKEKIEELINSSQIIVYDETNAVKKNRYFMAND
ncbi:B12-binding domain-containing radical SAM protein [Acidianus manzaensis]|uniref:B12-binding domain-containing radical SAM protein n=1 Tax=Acidianus manzaensis TaxID=282676 RepID=A0A1W6JYB9_9CREN|nr:radical SAM protein [Acidianus manzaensis]ARM75259.1 B12-binding domain-containing radical SAM protein [Acidianus manzaensis]